MKAPAIPPGEETRLGALHASRLAYSPAEEKFDRITRLARRIFDVPTAVISLVLDDEQWFKSRQGQPEAKTSREISFCGHAILQDDVFIVSDASADPDFADNPLVSGAPHLRFYAGCPILYHGEKLGTLCITDRKPRSMLPSDIDTLRSLAAWIEQEITTSSLGPIQTELLVERDESQREALIDPLTGAWNGNGLDELLMRELSRAKDASGRLVVMQISLESARTGDGRQPAPAAIAREFAQRIRTVIKPHDILAHANEGLFTVVLVDGDQAGAESVAKQILRGATTEPFDTPDGLAHITVSVGVAHIGRPEYSLINREEAVLAAGNALRAARKLGPNRISHVFDNR